MRKPHRQICSLCHEVDRVTFKVPDEVWQLSLHQSQWNNLVCLSCFTRLADERGVQWDKDIKFFPMSFITHRGITESKDERIAKSTDAKPNPKPIETERELDRIIDSALEIVSPVIKPEGGTGIKNKDTARLFLKSDIKALIAQERKAAVREAFDRIADLGRPNGQFMNWKPTDIANFFIALGELERELKGTQPHEQ